MKSTATPILPVPITKSVVSAAALGLPRHWHLRSDVRFPAAATNSGQSASGSNRSAVYDLGATSSRKREPTPGLVQFVAIHLTRGKCRINQSLRMRQLRSGSRGTGSPRQAPRQLVCDLRTALPEPFR